MKKFRTIPSVQFLESSTLRSATLHEDAPAALRPTPAAGLSASVAGNKVTLTWTDTATNESGYQVYRLAAKGGPVLVGTLAANATTFVDNAAPAGSDVYVVRAFNAKGNSEKSPMVTVKIAETVRVVAPNVLKTEAVSTTSLKLTWQGDLGATGGYKVERRLGGDSGTWVVVGTTAANARTFTDSGLTAGQKAAYRVTAVNTNGTTAVSATVVGQSKMTDKKDGVKPGDNKTPVKPESHDDHAIEPTRK